jgi:hypothetical protein
MPGSAKRIQENFERIDEKIKKLDEEKKNLKGEELVKKERELCRLWKRVYPFPHQKLSGKKTFTKRYPTHPTRLGNIIREYETYPYIAYGIEMALLWLHMWFSLPKEVQKEMEVKSAFADCFIYAALIFLIYAFWGGFWFLFWGNRGGALCCCILSGGMSWFLARISASQHFEYGKSVKAIFDLYLKDLAKNLNINQDDKEAWEEVHNRLDYQKKREEGTKNH